MNTLSILKSSPVSVFLNAKVLVLLKILLGTFTSILIDGTYCVVTSNVVLFTVAPLLGVTVAVVFDPVGLFIVA